MDQPATPPAELALRDLRLRLCREADTLERRLVKVRLQYQDATDNLSRTRHETGGMVHHRRAITHLSELGRLQARLAGVNFALEEMASVEQQAHATHCSAGGGL